MSRINSVNVNLIRFDTCQVHKNFLLFDTCGDKKDVGIKIKLKMKYYCGHIGCVFSNVGQLTNFSAASGDGYHSNINIMYYSSFIFRLNDRI